MAQRKFHQKVETWFFVTFISVLVWLYAEATVLKEESKILQIRFTEPTGRYAVYPRDDQSVRVTFKGSSGQRQRFQELTGQTLMIPVEAKAGEAQQELLDPLDEKLLATELGELGITDLAVDPQVLPVNLREIQELQIPVEIDPGAAILETRSADPPIITVSAPADRVEEFRNAKVVARLPASEVAGKEPGQQSVATNVRLEFPEGIDPNKSPWITAVVRDVRINYTLADNDQSTVKTTVPIFINLPVDQQNSYVVELADQAQVLRDVRLTGPAEVIAGIESGDPDFAVWAEIKPENLSELPDQTVFYPAIRGGRGVHGIETDHPATTTEGVKATIRLRDANGS